MFLRADGPPSARRALVGATGVVGVGLGLWLVAGLGPVRRFDLRVSKVLHDLTIESDRVADAARWLTRIGDPITLWLLVGAAVIWLAVERRVADAVWLAAVCFTGGLLVSLLKVIVHRARPEIDEVIVTARGFSFPSGHASNTTVVMSALAIVLTAGRRRRSAIAALLAAAIVAAIVGLTRVVLGVHFATDVAAGWLVGALWLLATRRVGTDLRRPRRGRTRR